MLPVIHKTVTGGSTTHPLLGEVIVRVHPATRKVTYRWTAGMPHVTIPQGLTPGYVDTLIDRIAPRLAQMKPETVFYDGKVIDMPFMILRYAASSAVEPSRLVGRRDVPSADGRPSATISFSNKADTADASFQAALSRYSSKVAQQLAGKSLLDFAVSVADSVNIHPRSWAIGSGTRTLGTCSSLGRVTLSRYLLFFPIDLVEYVIKHELAHLIHHDHSPQFHHEVNRMCGGREAELQQRLRAYRWPILR